MSRGRGRPGGNPDLVKHQFKAPDGQESNTEILTIRIPQSLKEKLNALGKNRNFAIRKVLEELVKSLA